MRKTVLLLLLASAAPPAMAAAGPDERETRRAERAERSEVRSEAREQRQADRPPREERAAPAPEQIETRNIGGSDRGNSAGGSNPSSAVNANVDGQARPRLRTPEMRREIVEQRREIIEQRRAERDGAADQPQTRPRRDIGDSVRVWRGEQRERVRRPGSTLGEVVAPPRGARPDRPAPPPKVTNAVLQQAKPWRSSWRNDHRYDWRRHRDRNRWLFNLGYYFDPFGWGYRRYPVGWRMYRNYYSSNYWLDDPWMYRLPQAYGPYRWVRYWNDALLVNLYTGEVVDVMHSFFW